MYSGTRCKEIRSPHILWGRIVKWNISLENNLKFLFQNIKRSKPYDPINTPRHLTLVEMNDISTQILAPNQSSAVLFLMPQSGNKQIPIYRAWNGQMTKAHNPQEPSTYETQQFDTHRNISAPHKDRQAEWERTCTEPLFLHSVPPSSTRPITYKYSQWKADC